MANKSLTNYLKEEKNRKRKIFVPYIMAGANGLENLQEEITMLEDCGATAIELGIPFSDPVADGPIIQSAGLDSLNKGTTLKKIIKYLQTIDSRKPLILMGYFNSFLNYGLDNLFKDLEETNVKGLIIPDLPYEHLNLIMPYSENSDIAIIPLVTLTSSEERIRQLSEKAEGFIYAVTVKGVTGIGKNYQDSLDDHLQTIMKVSNIPVLAGFGVSSEKDVERFSKVCDGVVIGSKIVSCLSEQGVDDTSSFVKRIVSPIMD